MFTIFGAAGFIGSSLNRFLVDRGHEVQAYDRHNWPAQGTNLGHVLFAIGMNANFRSRPIETADAHVSTLIKVVRDYTFNSLLYFSSTRVYAGAKEGSEISNLIVNPCDKESIYNITKLSGEAVCLALPMESARVVRLSNVVGRNAPPDNFLPNVIRESRASGTLVLRSSFESTKDYIDVESVCSLIISIATGGKRRLYNVASGFSTSNATIAALLRDCLGTNVSAIANAPTYTFPSIDVQRISNEFGFSPLPFPATFKKLLI